MPAKPSAFEQARKSFNGAHGDARVVTKAGKECPECGTPMDLTQTFKGESVHTEGKCPKGHQVERYGYVGMGA